MKIIMGEPAVSNYSYEAYLALEAESDTKHEFHDGFIVAMAGGTPEHGLIATNFTRATGNALEKNGKSCGIYSSDVKVYIPATKRTFYPDASIICGPPEKSDKDAHAITNPELILEVLSQSTVAFDRGTKFTHYRQLKSLREYVLISQDEAVVDTYYRTDDGTWDIQTIMGLDALVKLKSIGCEVRMGDIYRLVEGVGE